VTLTSYRCLPDGGCSRPRPDRFALDAVAGLAASGPLAAVDAYGRPSNRPRWLAGEYLALLERQGRGIGVIYLIHFDQPIGDLGNPRGYATHYTGRAASSGLLKVLRRADGAEFAELAWVDRVGPPGAPGTPPAPRHRLRVVGDCVLGAVVGTAVLLGTVAAGAVVVGTTTGAVVVGAGPDGDGVDVPGAWVAGGIDLSALATTTPTDVLPPCCDRLPNKLASGWLATVSTPVIAATAIPKASTAATATRCQRIGWGCASLAASSLAASSLAPACSPTRRRSERRATRWADASEWVYRASAGATSRLATAAPMRVPSTPNKDATTAPLTAASAPASNLGMRSCSIPHLDGRVGDGGAAVWGPRARPDRNPAAAWRAPTLATQAGSCQLPPGHEGDRAAWGSHSLGDRSFKAALVGRAELQAAQGPGGPEVAHDPEHVASPRVHQSQRAGTVSDSRAEILLINQESCSSIRARRARWLSRDNARAALSNALTNSRQIQHWTLDLPARLILHAAGRGARLMQVVGEQGIGWQLARIWTGTRTRERSLKRSGGADAPLPGLPAGQARPWVAGPADRSARCGAGNPRCRLRRRPLAGAPTGGGRMTRGHPPASPAGLPAACCTVPPSQEGTLMAPEISDRDSAAACLGWLRELAARLDLDHPDPLYQAGKADQLARAAKDLLMTCACSPRAAGCAATWSSSTAGRSWPTAPRTSAAGPATIWMTTGPAYPPAPPTATTTPRGAPYDRR
jgi:hypothetical protein